MSPKEMLSLALENHTQKKFNVAKNGGNDYKLYNIWKNSGLSIKHYIIFLWFL